MIEAGSVKARAGYPLKRAFDVVVSLSVLFLASPLLVCAMIAVWAQDRYSPFYMAKRVARTGGTFTMIKIRSMIVRAEASGVNSTGVHDNRITRVGQLIRKFKIDELSQFINVLFGDMSVVGPRPNTWRWGVELYTETEQAILSVRPGITDPSSIIFSDEGNILDGAENPDLLYNQIIRPWKNRLALWYIENMTLAMDFRIAWLTAVAIVNKRKAISGICALLEAGGADAELIAVCRRTAPLPPAPPPGGAEIETGARYLDA